MAIGIPTFLDRPATTTFFPSVGIPDEGKNKTVRQQLQGQRSREDGVIFTCAFDDFPYSPGCSRKHGGLIQAHAAHVDHMEAVHVLCRWNGIAYCALVNVICERVVTKARFQDRDFV